MPSESVQQPLKPDYCCSAAAYRENRKAPAVRVPLEEQGDARHSLFPSGAVSG